MSVYREEEAARFLAGAAGGSCEIMQTLTPRAGEPHIMGEIF